MNALKSKALYFLARREYAYLELFNKLKKYSEDLNEIKTVLDALKDHDYLSDKRYIESYINSKKNKVGIAKIKYNLKLKSGNIDLIDNIIRTNPIDEYTAAKTLFDKKFLKVVAKDKTELARQIRFLQNKGFSFDVINKVIKMKDLKCYYPK